ncbi:MAG: ArsA family ATPase [Acidimicrobiia bacterium]
MTSESFSQLLVSKEILVFCGPGGVGKTSTAAASALAAALQSGGKTLVLTIDPARRLADALGLEGIGNIERRVPDDLLKAAGIEARGELWVAMLDTKQSWDALVLRHAPDAETANRILENPLYSNITSRFIQSHDYVAMERLFELHASGTYDCIIVDTPPSRNALDFLDAPRRMAEFFGGRLIRWLTLPYRATGTRGARVFAIASKPFTQIADRLLGGPFLSDIAEFFVNFQSMYDGFVARANEVERLLHDPRTGFVVITALEPAPAREARSFCAELARRRYALGAVICNRVLPAVLTDSQTRQAAELLSERAESCSEQLIPFGFADPARTQRLLHTLAQSYLDYAILATREREIRATLAQHGVLLVELPQFGSDISDLGGLAQMAQMLVGGETRLVR